MRIASWLVMPLLSAAWAAPAAWTVCGAGCGYTNLQTAIDAAATYQDSTSCVPVILSIRAGEVFTGTFTLPAKNCRKYVHLRSSRLAELPAGVRVVPADAAKMPRLISPPANVSPTLVTADGSGTGYWALEGLEITQPDLGTTTKYSLVQIGNMSPAENLEARTPHHVVIDRSYLHGVPLREGPVRCLALHSRITTVSNSYLSECKSGTTDAQGIWMGQSLGPVLIVNNYIEGSTENFLAGGANAVGNSAMSVQGRAQRDLRFIGNHFRKKPEWKRTVAAGVPARVCMVGEYQQDTLTSQWYTCSAAPAVWTATAVAPPYFSEKNLFELKDGQGVYVYGNVLEKAWEAAQPGSAFLFNQSGGYTPNFDVRDVRMIANRIQEVNVGVAFGNLNYLVNPAGNTLTRQVSLEHNVFSSVGAPYLNYQPSSARFLMTHRSTDIVYRHNTLYHYPGAGSYGLIGNNNDANPSLAGFNFIGDSIFDSTFSGFVYLLGGGGSHCFWRNVITQAGAASDMRKNVFINAGSVGDNCTGGSGPVFPADTVQSGSINNVLENPAAGNFRVKSTATAARGTATDGLDLGANIDLVEWATAGSVNGQDNPFLRFQIRGHAATPSGATIWFTAPAASDTCTLTASLQPSLTPAAGSVTITRTGRSGRATISGLSSDRRYHYRVACGSWNLSGTLRTTP